jgi:Ca2+-transporting ATPase
MVQRNVIVRRLLAVEALGSCIVIATDKTGTLTVNQLSVRCIAFPDGNRWEVSGQGVIPQGTIVTPRGVPSREEQAQLAQFCHVTVLANEGFLGQSDSGWSHHGDAVDVAFLVMAYKAGITRAEMERIFPEVATIAYESEQLFSASLNEVDGRSCAFVKGAFERLLPMCATMSVFGQDVPLDSALINQQAHVLASSGYRVLALASGNVELSQDDTYTDTHLHGLTLLR